MRWGFALPEFQVFVEFQELTTSSGSALGFARDWPSEPVHHELPINHNPEGTSGSIPHHSGPATHGTRPASPNHLTVIEFQFRISTSRVNIEKVNKNLDFWLTWTLSDLSLNELLDISWCSPSDPFHCSGKNKESAIRDSQWSCLGEWNIRSF